MEQSPSSYNAFFQPLLPDFLNSFSIPAAFLKEELKVGFKSVVLMREKKGKEKLKHWVVKINEGRHFNAVDWKKFALRHHLKVGDFVIFRHLGNLVFNVSVFDSLTSCDSHYISPQQQQQQEVSTNNGPPTCQFTLTPYYVKHSIIYLPRRFVREVGLKNSCLMTLTDAKKRLWEVRLGHKRRDGQSYIGRGWRAFQEANGLKPNDVIKLQLLTYGNSPVFSCCRVSRSRRNKLE